MTPKEKAIELVDKYSPLVTTWDIYNDMPEKDENILRDAKKCALIAVDEILIALDYEDLDVKNYYNEVKTEIELL